MGQYRERWGYIWAECLFTIETKLVLFEQGCYKFKMLVVITKVTTKKRTKKYTEKEQRR